jgi:acetyl-CoA carboxylase carboxyltransferase component
MEPLETHLDPTSADFKKNREPLQSLVDELNAKLAVARAGGGEKYIARHKEQGKMPPRERIAALLDPETSALKATTRRSESLGLECFECSNPVTRP